MEKFITSALSQLIRNRHINKILAKKIDDYIYENIVANPSEDLKAMRLKR